MIAEVLTKIATGNSCCSKTRYGATLEGINYTYRGDRNVSGHVAGVVEKVRGSRGAAGIAPSGHQINLPGLGRVRGALFKAAVFDLCQGGNDIPNGGQQQCVFERQFHGLAKYENP